MHRKSDGIAVLHVDDDPEIADVTATFIERQDERLAVETATSASDGLERLAENTVDCIVSDYNMSGKNGVEFLEAVREIHPDLPFILYTGKGSEEVASEAISAGVTDYLQKESGTSQYEVLANRILNVVEQQRAQIEVSNMEDRLWAIAENTTDLLWMFTADWTELLFVNSAYEDIWGRSTDELRAEPRSFVQGIHPDDRDRVEEAMAQLSAGESVDLEYRVNETENFSRWVWVLGEPVFDDAGEVKWVVGFARDVTDRKEREQQLQRYKIYLDHINDLVTVFDTNGVIKYESPSVEDILGYEPDERVGEDGFEYVHPEDRDSLRSQFRASAESNSRSEPGPPEFRIQHRDGSWQWFEGRATFHTDEFVGAVIGTSRDITERKQREQELQELRERTEFALRETNTAIWIWDADNSEVQTLYNQIDEIVGHEGEAIEGVEDFLQNAVHPDDRSKVAGAYERAIRGEDERLQIDFRTNSEVSDRRWIRAIGHLESDADSRVLVGLLLDITEQKRREDQLEKFASVVSHDLRNPLNVAQGRLEFAKEECTSEHHDAIESALDRMNRIIEDVLWLAREGQVIGSVEPIELSDALDSAWAMVADRSDSATLRFAGDESQLPPVAADYDRLCQLLENVLANALEHAGDDVTVTAGVLGDGFYIEDDGPGIPEEHRADVFEPGYSSSTGGAGLGLNIVKQVADAHGWDIRVTDGSDGGVRFEITDVAFPE